MTTIRSNRNIPPTMVLKRNVHAGANSHLVALQQNAGSHLSLIQDPLPMQPNVVHSTSALNLTQCSDEVL